MAFLSTNNIKGDIFGGITAGIVALPLALAFGIQAFGGIDDPAAPSMGALAGLSASLSQLTMESMQLSMATKYDMVAVLFIVEEG